MSGSSISPKISGLNLAAALLAVCSVQGEGLANPFLRGTFNNWSAEEMLGAHMYIARDIINIAPCDSGVAQFKFDTNGDWSRNFGDNDNARGFNPSQNRWEGRLDTNGENIRIPCGKTYFIGFENYSEDQTFYGFRELAKPVPEALKEGEKVVFRKAVRVGGQYGWNSFVGELLVQQGLAPSQLGVVYLGQGGERKLAEAQFQKSLSVGFEVWRFVAGGYGTIELLNVSFETDGMVQTSPISQELVAN
jgi:hypothetical protein